MPSPKDSERRKARDAALRTQGPMIAEHLEQARRSGELRSAESFGKPLFEAEGWEETPTEFRLPFKSKPLFEAEGWEETPTEFRLPFKILKNAGVPPPEVELFHRRAALRRELAECACEQERQVLRQRLSELEQFIALRLEAMRVTGKL